MSLPHVTALERRASARASVRNHLERTGHSLREHFNALNLEKQIANFRMNLMLNYMIRMTISS